MAGPLAPEDERGILGPALANPLMARQVLAARAANARPDATDIFGYGPGAQDWGQWLKGFAQNVSKLTPVDVAMGFGPNIIAGPMAKTANRKALFQAATMEGAGASRKDIWDATGWFKGPDGKWKYEIDDSAANIFGMSPQQAEQKAAPIRYYGREIVAKEDRGLRYGDVLQHPELYNAYNFQDRLASVRPYENPLQQASLDRYGILGLNERLMPAEARSSALHEMQHAIQHEEGFAPGGSPTSFERLRDSAKARIDFLNDELSGYAQAIDKLGGSDRLINMKAGGYQLGPDELRIESLLNKYNRALDEKMGLIDTVQADPYEQYARLAGEAEARMVQRRMDLTPEQRKATPPWLSYDVPEAQQILRPGGGDGSMLSVPKKPAGPLDPETHGLARFWSARTWKTEDEAREMIRSRITEDNERYPMFSPSDPNIVDKLQFVRARGGEVKLKQPYQPRGNGPEWSAEPPAQGAGSAPSVDWTARDLEDNGTAASIMKEFGRNGRGTVQQAWIPINELPKPRGEDIKDGLLTENSSAREDLAFRSRSGPPPVKVRVGPRGKVEIMDGNHRIAYWREQGYTHVPAYVIDERGGGILKPD